MRDQKRVFIIGSVGVSVYACRRASVKYGAIIVEIKGSVGGTTFQGGHSGPVMLTKGELIDAVASGSKLTKADAGRVMQPQQGIGTTSTTWRDLTDAQRQSWIAAAVQFPFKNRFGVTYTPSGFQLYMSCNANLRNYSCTPIDVSPLPTSLIPAGPLVITVGALGATMVATEYTVINGFKGAIFMSVAQSAGKSFDPGRLKCISVYDPDNWDGEDIKPAYEAIFGTLPTHGTIWYQARAIVIDAGLPAPVLTGKVTW